MTKSGIYFSQVMTLTRTKLFLIHAQIPFFVHVMSVFSRIAQQSISLCLLFLLQFSLVLTYVSHPDLVDRIPTIQFFFPTQNVYAMFVFTSNRWS